MILRLLQGDCLEVMATLADGSLGAVVCDPPYGLTGENGTTATGFLALEWDRSGIIFDPVLWGHLHRVLRPGGKVKVFGSTRRFHRVAQAMEAAGLVVQGLQGWCYASGFPKSVNLSLATDALVLTGKADSRALRYALSQRPVVGTARRVVSTGRAAAQGESRQGVKANMERWLNHTAQDIPVTTGLTPLARALEGFGTCLRPAWEPVLVGSRT